MIDVGLDLQHAQLPRPEALLFQTHYGATGQREWLVCMSVSWTSQPIPTHPISCSVIKTQDWINIQCEETQPGRTEVYIDCGE